MNFTEMVFRLWFCCLITSGCMAVVTVLGIALLADNAKKKKKAHLGRGEQGDVKNTSSNLHN